MQTHDEDPMLEVCFDKGKTLQQTWNDFQQQHQFKAVPEILFNILNLRACFPQMGVAPGCKRLGKKVVRNITYDSKQLFNSVDTMLKALSYVEDLDALFQQWWD